MTSNNTKNNKKRNLSITVVAAVAILAVFYAQNGAAAIQPQITVSQDPIPALTVTPFDFELPDGAVDGKRYTHVNEGTPESDIQQGTTVFLPIIIRPSGNAGGIVDFYTTFGDQLDTPKMPPGVHVSVEPSTVVLQPGHDSVINMIVHVDKDAPDGTYMQNIVGKWGGPNDFMGSAVSLKVGKGTAQFLFPGDISK